MRIQNTVDREGGRRCRLSHADVNVRGNRCDAERGRATCVEGCEALWFNIMTRMTEKIGQRRKK